MSDQNLTSPKDNSTNEGLLKPVVVSPKSKASFAWIWLIPIIAALVGLSFFIRSTLSKGPEVTITFKTAEGLGVGKSEVRYKDVSIGQVKAIALSDEHDKVEVTVALTKNSDFLLHDGTRFWVVKPRFSTSGVSGLDTLLSGSYLEVDTTDTQNSNAMYKDSFIGLDKPPEISSDRPGKRFVLRATNLGSLDIGSPIYYRRFKVGQVVGYELNDDGAAINIQVFIDAPYDKFVTENSRFWNASGLDVSLNASGFNLKTQSLLSVAAGGIAFSNVVTNDPEDMRPAQDNSTFVLSDTESKALAKPDGLAFPVRMRFDTTVRGLTVGAPVEFKGISLGEIRAISLDFDVKSKKSTAVIDAVIYENRVASIINSNAGNRAVLNSNKKPGDDIGAQAVKAFLASGVRGQLRTGSFITGQLYVALEYFPNEKSNPVNLNQSPVNVPTVPGNLDELQKSFEIIMNKIKAVPFDKMGQNLSLTLEETSKLLATLNKNVSPQLVQTMKSAQKTLGSVSGMVNNLGDSVGGDGDLMRNIRNTLLELNRTLRSVKQLSDDLQVNPQSLIRGRTNDPINVHKN